MHELSIALSILDIAAEVAGRHLGRVVAVRVKLGPLSGVQKEALGWAFDLAKEDTILAAAKLVIDETRLSAYCSACSAVRTLQSEVETVLSSLRRADSRDQERARARSRCPRD